MQSFFLQIIKSIKTLLAYLNINFYKWHKTEVAYLLCVSKDERLLCLPWEHHLEQAQRCWQWCWCLFLFGPECCTRTHGCCHSSLDSWGTKELPHCWRLLNRTQLQTKKPQQQTQSATQQYDLLKHIRNTFTKINRHHKTGSLAFS